MGRQWGVRCEVRGDITDTSASVLSPNLRVEVNPSSGGDATDSTFLIKNSDLIISLDILTSSPNLPSVPILTEETAEINLGKCNFYQFSFWSKSLNISIYNLLMYLRVGMFHKIKFAIFLLQYKLVSWYDRMTVLLSSHLARPSPGLVLIFQAGLCCPAAQVSRRMRDLTDWVNI